MNLFLKLINATILILFFISCVAPILSYQVKSNQEGIETRYIDGNKVATSKKPNSSLFITSIKKNEYGGGINKVKFLIADIVIKNNSENEVNFIPENVKAIGFNSENQQKVLKGIRPDNFLKKMRKIQAISNAAQAIGGAMSNMDAGKTTSTTNSSSNTSVTGNSNTYGSFSTNSGYSGSGQAQSQFSGTSKTSGSSTTTTIDHDARKKADKEAQQELLKIREMQRSHTQSVESMLLKANTLAPGQVIGGKLIIEYSSSHNKSINIDVPFSSDNHRIKYSLVK